MNSRLNQANLWVDKDFLVWLKKLKGKKEADGIEIRNLAELTKQIIQTEAIKDVEVQILKDKQMSDIRIKMDSKRFLR